MDEREGRPIRTAIPPFQAFLEQNRDVVFRFLVSSTGPGDAEDLFQETFLAALRAYPKLRDGSSLRSWVLTIATRKVIDAARAAKRRPLASSEDGAAEGGAEDEVSMIDIKDPLWRAVSDLPAKQRAAVVHRFVLDRSYGEVAAALGCSEEAARANVSEAVRKLRERVSHADALR